MLSISVVIPYFNRHDTIGDTLASVFSQTISPLEVIIVNDGSTPSSLAHLQQITAAYDNVRIISKPNAGVSSARNLGILSALGDAVAFLDSDDVWNEQHLEDALKMLNVSPELMATVSNYQYFQTNDGVTEETSSIKQEGWIKVGECVSDVEFIIKGSDAATGLCSLDLGFHTSSLVIRNLSPNYVFFDTALSFGEDVDFLTALALRGNIGYINKINTGYRIHDDNTVSRHNSLSGVSHTKLLTQLRSLEKRLVYSDKPAIKIKILNALSQRYYLVAQSLSNRTCFRQALDWYNLSFRLKPNAASLKHIIAQRIFPSFLLKKLY